MKWLPARAYDNAVYAIFSNPIGMDDDQQTSDSVMSGKRFERSGQHRGAAQIGILLGAVSGVAKAAATSGGDNDRYG